MVELNSLTATSWTPRTSPNPSTPTSARLAMIDKLTGLSTVTEPGLQRHSCCHARGAPPVVVWLAPAPATTMPLDPHDKPYTYDCDHCVWVRVADEGARLRRLDDQRLVMGAAA